MQFLIACVPCGLTHCKHTLGLNACIERLSVQFGSLPNHFVSMGEAPAVLISLHRRKCEVRALEKRKNVVIDSFMSLFQKFQQLFF